MAAGSEVNFNASLSAIETLSGQARLLAANAAVEQRLYTRSELILETLRALGAASTPEDAERLTTAVADLGISYDEYFWVLREPVPHMLKNPSVRFRVQILAGLGQIVSIKRLRRSELGFIGERIIPLLFDETPAIRLAAAQALTGLKILNDDGVADMTNPFMVNLMKASIADVDPLVRGAAMVAWKSIRFDALPRD